MTNVSNVMDMVKSYTFTNVEVGENCVNVKKWWESRKPFAKVKLEIVRFFDDGAVSRVDISETNTLTKLSALLKRADLGTYIVVSVTPKTNSGSLLRYESYRKVALNQWVMVLPMRASEC